MKRSFLDSEGSRVKQRILYIIGSLNVGGAEGHVAMVSAELLQRGWKPEILCLAEEGTLAPQLRAKGVPVHVLTLAGRKVRSFPVRILRQSAAFLSCFLFLRRHRPSVVHFFLPFAYIVGGICAWGAGIAPRIMSRRSLNLYQRKYLFIATIERWLHSHMTLIVGNSKAVMNDLAGEGIPKGKLQLIYNGIDLAPFNVSHDRRQTRLNLGVPEDSLMIVIVANMIPYKGHEDLLLALGRVKDQLPVNWRLVCVGRDDGHGHSLKALASSLGIGSAVLWVGMRADIPEIYTAADIGVLCSHEEGFSNAVLEGMAAGLPMVVTNVGGNAEAIHDGEAGYVVPPRNPVALANAIVKLANDENRRDLGKLGRRRVEEHFSLSACVDAYDKLYAGLIKTAPNLSLDEPVG